MGGNSHGHWCSLCKKFIRSGDIDKHFDKHLKKNEIFCNKKCGELFNGKKTG